MTSSESGGARAAGSSGWTAAAIWYTAQSGIWQTVWLEPVPRSTSSASSSYRYLEDAELEVTVVGRW